MSELRNQLAAARQAYRSQRYPGDLADVLPRRRAALARGNWSAVAGLAAAAAVLLGLGEFAMVLPARAGERVAITSDDAAFIRVRWDDAARPPVIAVKAPPMPVAAAMSATPAPMLMSEARQPVVDSAQYIVNVGKDLVHQAGALFNSM